MEFKIGTKFNDVLTNEVIENWDGNVILDGATGSGKTYFIENNLYDYASRNFKNILFLCNRTALYNDICLEKAENNLFDLDIMLYQTLQCKLLTGEELKHYDYIVCDEIHYVQVDAMFNVYTNITYDWITTQDNSIVVYMSGTGTSIFDKLIKDKIVKLDNYYKIPYDYSYANIKFYKKKCDVYNIINTVLTNTDEEKVIYFANSISDALSVYKQFKQFATLRVSEHVKNDEAKSLNNVNCIKTYNKDLITYENRLLITTKALDNGITLKDRNIKHIISDIFDLDSAQQCLGRKRIIDDNDKCTFYIRDYNKKAIGNFKGGINNQLKPIETFVTDKDMYFKMYSSNRKFHSDYIYPNIDGQLTYNKLAYWKLQNESDVITLSEELSYRLIFLSHLEADINYDDLEWLEEYQMKDEFQLYLNNLVGEKLFKEEQEELKKQFEKAGLKDRTMGINTLNGKLNDENIPYKIVAKKSNGKRYWTIENHLW